MKVGDLVRGKNILWADYGIGIIFARHCGAFKVYWPKTGFWCITSEAAVKQITDKKCP